MRIRHLVLEVPVCTVVIPLYLKMSSDKPWVLLLGHIVLAKITTELGSLSSHSWQQFTW